MVKNTCRNRFAAFRRTARRYSHDSPDIMFLVLPDYAMWSLHTSSAVEEAPGQVGSVVVKQRVRVVVKSYWYSTG